MSVSIADLRSALAQAPADLALRQRLVQRLCESGGRGAALQLASEGVALNPGCAAAQHLLALARLENLDVDGALAGLQQALLLEPGKRDSVSVWAYLSLLRDADAERLASQRRQLVGQAWPSRPAQGAAPAHARPLRVGLLSADLHDHPVGHFLRALVHLDPARVALQVFDCGSRQDAVHAQLRNIGAVWHALGHADDAELLQQLRSAQLDLLLDLSGHTGGQRLAVLAERAAPRQLSWLGYPVHSGLAAIDWHLSDAIVHSAGTADAGRVLHLNGHFACYTLPPDAPMPARREPSPHCILGAPHRLEKLTPALLQSWGRILRAVPEARLRFARDQLDPGRMAWLRQRLHEAEVPLGQVMLQRLPDEDIDHRSLWNHIDLLLDCQPWSGHTLGCEALAMGVPVVTLSGPSPQSRLLAAALHAADRSTDIAADWAQYEALAIDYARRGPRSTPARQRLASGVARSRLCDGPRFAAALTDALEQACVLDAASSATHTASPRC